jgi:hypothetical protein
MWDSIGVSDPVRGWPILHCHLHFANHFSLMSDGAAAFGFSQPFKVKKVKIQRNWEKTRDILRFNLLTNCSKLRICLK